MAICFFAKATCLSKVFCNCVLFEIEGLNSKIKDILSSNWILVSDVKETQWGNIAVIEDLDGRKIELKNK